LCVRSAYRLYGEEDMSHVQRSVGITYMFIFQWRVQYLYESR